MDLNDTERELLAVALDLLEDRSLEMAIKTPEDAPAFRRQADACDRLARRLQGDPTAMEPVEPIDWPLYSSVEDARRRSATGA